MKKSTLLGGAAALAFVFAPMGYADTQQAPGQQPAETQQEKPLQTQQGQTDQTRDTARNDAGASQARNQQLVSANDLIGMAVMNDQDQELGEVQEIVLDSQQDRVAYVVLSYGGFLDIGDKYFAVPWSAFQHEQDDTLTLSFDQQKLENAPGFDQENWPDMANPEFRQGVNTFYGTEPYERNNRDMRNDNTAIDENEANESEQYTSNATDLSENQQDTQWARRLSSLIGMSIENNSQESVGSLEDVMIDEREGRVVYGIVSYGGFVGLFDSLAAVPFDALRIQTQRETIAFNGDQADLEATTLSNGSYEQLADNAFSRQVHERFAEEPYWLVHGYVSEQGNQKPDQLDTQTPGINEDGRTPAPQANQNDQARNDQQNQKNEMDKLAKAGQQVTLTGTIRSIGNYLPQDAEPSQRGMRLRLETGQGTATVLVCSRDALRSSEVNLNRGDQITVKGESTRHQGRLALDAKSIEKDGKTIQLDKQKKQGEMKNQGDEKINPFKPNENDQNQNEQNQQDNQRSETESI